MITIETDMHNNGEWIPTPEGGANYVIPGESEPAVKIAPLGPETDRVWWIADSWYGPSFSPGTLQEAKVRAMEILARELTK